MAQKEELALWPEPKAPPLSCSPLRSHTCSIWHPMMLHVPVPCAVCFMCIFQCSCVYSNAPVPAGHVSGSMYMMHVSHMCPMFLLCVCYAFYVHVPHVCLSHSCSCFACAIFSISMCHICVPVGHSPCTALLCGHAPSCVFHKCSCHTCHSTAMFHVCVC